jgi:hypothetical protein
MPAFWLELLQTELLGRSFKHTLAHFMNKNNSLKSSVSMFLATSLNYIFGNFNGLSEDTISAQENNEGGKKGGKKNKKLKPNNTPGEEAHLTSVFSFDNSEGMPTRQDFLEQLEKEMLSRFNYKLSSIILIDNNNNKKNTYSNSELSARIPRVALLRRLCQQGSFSLNIRNFDFSNVTPFLITDIDNIFPVVKVSESSDPIPEVAKAFELSRYALQRGDLQMAYQTAQEANIWVQSVAGSIHKDAIAATDLNTAIMAQAGDMVACLQLSKKSLSLNLQLNGLDHHSTMAAHIQVSSLCAELHQYSSACEHLLAAKYILSVIAGPRHPQHIEILLKLASYYKAMGQFSDGVKCLKMTDNLICSERCSNQIQHATILNKVCIALIDMGIDYSDEAMQHAKAAYTIFSNAFGPNSEQTVQAKALLVDATKKITTMKVIEAKAVQANKAIQAEKASLDWLGEENLSEMATPYIGKGTGNSKKNKKKKSNKSE